MGRSRPANLVVVGLYTLATAALLWVPLLNVLHAEASVVIATLAFFVAGLDAIALFATGTNRAGTAMTRELAYLVVPFTIYQIARAWIPGCSFLAGLKYYLLFPVITVAFAVALAFLIVRLGPRRPRLWFILVGIAIAVFPTIYDIGFHPQFYVYNHVYGGVLGPIYDLELSARAGLYWFRLLTLLWTGVIFLIGYRLREPVRGASVGIVLMALLIVAIYLNAGRLGINTTYQDIEAALGSEFRTEHFVIHYDSSTVTDNEIRNLAADHEFRYHQFAERLGFDAELPIHSYLYPNAGLRARLTGSGYTNIAPVWLGRPQTHVLAESYDQSFAHELAHVFSRQIGLPIIKASFHIGLVEGFAVALEPPTGLPSADDQVAALIQGSPRSDVYSEASIADAVATALSPAGFWTGRGAVSYTTMGSFVAYLLDQYGVESFAEVYRMKSFRSVYGKSIHSLAADWERNLEGRETDQLAADLAVRRFSLLSLFERHCPHDVPTSYSSYAKGRDLLAAGDSAMALRWFASALNNAPAFSEALDAWAGLKLAAGDYDEVITRIGSVWTPDSPYPSQIAVRMGDAFAVSGQAANATTLYRAGIETISPFARNWKAVVELRLLLTDRPQLISVVVSGKTPKEKAETLVAEEDTTGASMILAALYRAEAEEYGQAADELSAASGTRASTAVGERLPAWLAAFSFRAGRLEDAERFREWAVEAARISGDRYQIERLNDFHERIEWTAETAS